MNFLDLGLDLIDPKSSLYCHCQTYVHTSRIGRKQAFSFGQNKNNVLVIGQILWLSQAIYGGMKGQDDSEYEEFTKAKV